MVIKLLLLLKRGLNMVKTFEEFPVYGKGLQLVRAIEDLCSKTKVGKFGFLKDQIRRASSSIVLNIAEGSGKWNKKSKINFYRISQASANECLAAIDLFIAYRLINLDQAKETKEILKDIIMDLHALKKSIERRIK
jgi:four helix bundle protein